MKLGQNSIICQIGSLSYAFQFVNDVHVKITNPSGGTAKLRQDYYMKNAHTLNNYHKTKTIK